jgi:hypothetical protein
MEYQKKIWTRGDRQKNPKDLIPKAMEYQKKIWTRVDRQKNPKI